MRERLLDAPAWVLGLVGGTVSGVLWVLATRLVWQESWTESVVTGLIFGLVFGAVIGPVQRRQNRGLREAAARSPEGLSKRVRRAASRGPVPDDPSLRAAAHDVLLAQLAPLERQRIWGPAFFLGVGVLGVFLAVTDSAWWWIASTAWIAAAGGHRLLLLRLRRREELLRRDAPDG
jgi:uncharacterized membrane protein (UPF0136 family)